MDLINVSLCVFPSLEKGNVKHGAANVIPLISPPDFAALERSSIYQVNLLTHRPFKVMALIGARHNGLLILCELTITKNEVKWFTNALPYLRHSGSGGVKFIL